MFKNKQRLLQRLRLVDDAAEWAMLYERISEALTTDPPALPSALFERVRSVVRFFITCRPSVDEAAASAYLPDWILAVAPHEWTEEMTRLTQPLRYSQN